MKKVLKYLSVTQLMEDVRDMNGVMPVRRFVITTIAAGAGVYGACLLYRINYVLAFVVMLVAVAMIPGLVRNYFRECSEAARFADVDVYLHQMTYSFIRNPKVNMALKDAYAISTGRLKRCLSRAIEELEYGMGQRVYEDALRIIEEEYDCARIRTLHKFIVSVEEKGGRYRGAMEVLLEDFDRWVNNVYKYQNEIRKIKRDITIGIVISMLLALLTTVMCNMLCIVFYTFTRKHYGFDWIGKSRKDNQIINDYNSVFKSKAKQVTLRMVPIWAGMCAVVVLLVVMKLWIPALCLAGVMIVLMSTPFTQKKTAVKRVKNDLYCGFTEWLRDLAVNLENKPLLSAVEDTYDDCPVIMKEPLEKFIYDIELNPSDIKPYYEFLSEFNVMDIQSAVRMLYSIGDLDKDSMNQTINALVRRNYELSDKAENARYMDSTSMMRFSEYVPTFFVAFKMAVDMMLVVNMYL